MSTCGERGDFDSAARIAQMVGEAEGKRTQVQIQANALPLRIRLPITIDVLLKRWDTYYKDRLEMNVALLRDDKLALYQKLAAEALRDVEKSYASTQIWKSVYQQRYGLDGSDWNVPTFIENAVQKNVPEDAENITKFIKLRSIYVQLKRDKDIREGKIPVKSAGAAKPIGIGFGRKGGAKSAKQLKKRMDETDEDNDDEAGNETDGDDDDDDEDEEKSAPKRKRKRGGPKFGPKKKPPPIKPLCKPGDAVCLEKAYDDVKNDFNKLVMRTNRLAKEKNDCLKSHGGKQTWTDAAWGNIPSLLPVDEQIARLREVLIRADRELVGRTEILSRIAAIIHTFAHNHCAFTDAYLNFSLEGPAGSGKTTIARTIGKVFQYLGILLTDKFDVLAREDFVGGFLGETAIKTKAVLNSHIEGVILLDEAYSLGAGSDGKADPYGSEAITSIVGFLDKNQGRIVFMVAGYADKMASEFFAVNEGLARRFPLRFNLSNFEAPQLLKMFFQKTLGKISKQDLPMWDNKETWAYLLGALDTLNRLGHLPNQGGDIENIANNTLIFVNTYVRADPKSKLSPCDMQQILREYLFTSRRANIVVGNNEMNRQCNPFASCDPNAQDSVCVPLMLPNLPLLASTATAPPPTATPPPTIPPSRTSRQPSQPPRRRRGGAAPPSIPNHFGRPHFAGRLPPHFVQLQPGIVRPHIVGPCLNGAQFGRTAGLGALPGHQFGRRALLPHYVIAWPQPVAAAAGPSRRFPKRTTSSRPSP